MQSKDFVAAARQLLVDDKRSVDAARAKIEDVAQSVLLADLNKAVSLWELKAKAASARLRTIEAFALATTLLLLLLEGLFIFWPTYKTMVSALQQAEDERDKAIEAKAAATLAASARIKFLEHMTHELRTPLTAIIGRAEMIQEDISTAKIQDPDLESVGPDAVKIASEARVLLSFIEKATDAAVTGSGAQALNAKKFAA